MVEVLLFKGSSEIIPVNRASVHLLLQVNLILQGTVSEGEVKAYFRVLNPEWRVRVHQQSIKHEMRFYASQLLNPAIDDRLMQGLITSSCPQLAKNIVHVELNRAFTDNQTIGNIAIA